MARFFQFTDQNGDIVYLEPELIESIYTWPQDPTLTFIKLADGSIRVSATPAATLAAFFTTSTLGTGVETVVSLVAISVAAANPARKKLIIQNTGTAPVRIGDALVSPVSGVQLVPNGSMILDMPDCPTNEIFAIREGLVDSVVMSQEVT